jgi:hypothetical protein
MLAAAAAASIVAGCGSSGGSGGGPQGAQSWAAYNAEYLAEQQRLTLPSRITWPNKAPEPPTFEGSPQTFQAGVGAGQADGFWYCAWERRWLHDQSTTPAAASRDLANLKRFEGTSSYLRSTSASDRHIYSDAWARASLGDPALIQQHVTANCRGLGVSSN